MNDYYRQVVKWVSIKFEIYAFFYEPLDIIITNQKRSG